LSETGFSKNEKENTQISKKKEVVQVNVNYNLVGGFYVGK